MCGIGALLGAAASKGAVDEMTVSLERRGPDGTRVHKLEEAILVASVLHIQGTKMCGQPYVDEAGNVLLWNGEVFGVDNDNPYLLMPEVDSSDTICVSQLLSRVLLGSGCVVQEATTALSCIHGPYSFIYYHSSSGTLLFGRDPFGRRSLLLLRQHSDTIAAICSVAFGDFQTGWQEVPVGGIHQVMVGGRELTFAPWPSSRLRLLRMTRSLVDEDEDEEEGEDGEGVESFPAKTNKLGADAQASPQASPPASPSVTFLFFLRLAISKRLDRLAGIHSHSIGVLFSGGIDSVLLAALLHQCLESTRPFLSIELVNVTFLSPGGGTTSSSPDRLAAIAGVLELQTLYPSRPWKLVHVDVDSAERARQTARISQLIQPRDTHMDLNIATAFWFAARGSGYLRNYSSTADADIVGAQLLGRPLLRFGGLGAAKGVGLDEWSAPTAKADKVRAPCSQSPACGRWRKEGCVSGCCSKCCFATQRQGSGVGVSCSVHKMHKADLPAFPVTIEAPGPTKSEEEQHEAYGCTCKVLLVGIGADEQMAGYGRHRTTFSKGGEAALENELSMDMGRLWERNLGRDDRAISDNGREPWFPYLDEGVVAFLQGLPISSLADLTLPPGIGDKKILREAASSLGLRSTLVKRAVQFGSHISKASNNAYNKSNRKAKGTSKITHD